MHRSIVQITLCAGALAVAAGCSSASADGKLVDAMTGEPIAGVRIVAAAQDPDAALTCMSFEAETDAAGAFKLEGLCGGAYSVKTNDESLWLADFDAIPDGGATGLELKAWRAPAGSGLYKLHGSELEAVRTAADLKKEKIRGSDEKVIYPSRIPDNPPIIEASDHLVIVGQGTIENTIFAPLIPSDTRIFGDDSVKVTMDPWSYVGVKFTDDTTFEKVEAQIDDSKAIVKEKGDRIAKFLPGSALPEGRYALYQPEGRTITVVDFGKSQSKPKEAAENAAE